MGRVAALGLAIGVACGACAAPLPSELRRFEFHGRPIHPALVLALVCVIADPLPVVTAVELDGGTRSNRCRAAPVRRDSGWLAVYDEYTLGNGYLEYLHLGCTPGGTHVVITAWSGGGSGIFEDVLLLRFESDRVFEDGRFRERVIMKCVGCAGLGDRDDGVVEFDGHRLRIGPSQYRAAETILVVD